jgi:mono/diheme cytochrome c family protein
MRADDGTAFAARANLQRYGLRFCDEASVDPIGFVADADAGRAAAIGLTCAACHTGHLTDGKRDYLVVGGPATLDLQDFLQDLFVALLKVRSGSYQDAALTEDWQAFAAAVLLADSDPQAAKALHAEVTVWLQTRKDIQASLHGGGAWGPGRVDAAQMTANSMAVLSQSPNVAGLPAASAPVSIPHLWLAMPGTSANAADIGIAGSDGLSRPIAKTVGLFAEVTLPDPKVLADGAVAAVETSIRTDNLRALERVRAAITPPLWPQDWGVIDVASPDWAAGQAIYRAQCAACHALIDRARPPQALQDATGLALVAEPLGKGVDFVRRIDVFAGPVHAGPVLGTDPAQLCNAMALSSRLSTLDLQNLNEMRVHCASQMAALTKENQASVMGYLAGPLAGIFATAPYLHNGSVPTLDDLLLPPDQRPTRFAVGEVLFDPAKVGLGAALPEGAVSEFRVTSPKGRMLVGNANEGHAFPAIPLSAVQRAQLILYLKSL